MTRAGSWVGRAATAASVAVGAVFGTSVLRLDPEPVRVVLLAVLVVAGAGLLLDALPRVGATWYPAARHVPFDRGRDDVTQAHLRALENHHASRTPDAAVRDRLATLADQVLQVRHGTHAHTERGRELLGPVVVEVLRGPVVRLSNRRIDEVLRHIEEL